MALYYVLYTVFHILRWDVRTLGRWDVGPARGWDGVWESRVITKLMFRDKPPERHVTGTPSSS